MGPKGIAVNEIQNRKGSTSSISSKATAATVNHVSARAAETGCAGSLHERQSQASPSTSGSDLGSLGLITKAFRRPGSGPRHGGPYQHTLIPILIPSTTSAPNYHHFPGFPVYQYPNPTLANLTVIPQIFPGGLVRFHYGPDPTSPVGVLVGAPVEVPVGPIGVPMGPPEGESVAYISPGVAQPSPAAVSPMAGPHTSYHSMPTFVTGPHAVSAVSAQHASTISPASSSNIPTKSSPPTDWSGDTPSQSSRSKSGSNNDKNSTITSFPSEIVIELPRNLVGKVTGGSQAETLNTLRMKSGAKVGRECFWRVQGYPICCSVG